MLPNFIVIGAAKCGTTSICELLGKHNDVFMCNPKEPYFFCREDDYDDPAVKSWYESLFAKASAYTAVGEGSTAYTHPRVSKLTAHRIAEAIPDCKLIFMARHPIKRLESDWRMRRHEGWTPESINAAVKEQPTLVTHGMYWRNLKEYVNLFPDEQILVVFLEDFARSPQKELLRCFRHLGVDASVLIDDIQKPRNQSASFRKDGAIVSMFRNIRIAGRLKGMLPDDIKDNLKNILMKKQKFEIAWDQDLKQEITCELKKDAEIFLKKFGKPADYWDFDVTQ